MASNTRLDNHLNNYRKKYKKYYTKYGNILIIVVLAVILVPILFFFLTLPKSPGGGLTNNSILCTNGETQDCVNAENCEGTKTCVQGTWSNCIIPKICTPGEKKDCWIGCSKGYEICNECGIEYLECTPA